MKKKDFGWVRFATNTKCFVGENGCDVKAISKALLFPTRYLARTAEYPYKLDGTDVVRKVSLTKTGKPKAIIGRG